MRFEMQRFHAGGKGGQNVETKWKRVCAMVIWTGTSYPNEEQDRSGSQK